jgi:hypothetical protein
MPVGTWTTNSNLELPTLTLNVDYTIETSKLGKVQVFCYKPKTDSASDIIKAAIVKSFSTYNFK